MPYELKKGFESIVVEEEISYRGAAGLFDYSTPKNFYVAYDQYLFDKDLLYHEMAHLFAYRTLVLKTRVWQDIYESEWKDYTDLYGSKNPGEAFAESVAYYFSEDPEIRKLLYNRPKSKKFVEDILGLKQKYQK